MKDLLLNVGACIYCGDRKPPLTREHVLPRGLGGDITPKEATGALVLQNASCDACKEITRRIEERCLRGALDPGRARLGLKRRDRDSGRGRALVDHVDGSKEKCERPWDSLPGVIMLPSFYAAGFLAGRQILEPAPCDWKMIVVAPAKRSSMESVARVGVQLSADPKAFAQLLAKIAHGVAVAKFGLSGFESFVREFILKKPSEYGHWVGGFAGSDRVETATAALHAVNLKGEMGADGKLIVVEIRLFAEFNAPTNYVVVGRRIG